MSCTVISQLIFSNHMFTYLWNDIYENLVVKFVGLNLFSLLGSSSRSVDASSFGCVVILSLYLTLNFVISSLIVGIFNLLRPTGCVMHQQVDYFNNCTLCPYCICAFCICLRTNIDLCHLHQKLISFYKREKKCLLRGTDWAFKRSSLRTVF
jgi:hypothetical protein